jgi:hypothetical protein
MMNEHEAARRIIELLKTGRPNEGRRAIVILQAHAASGDAWAQGVLLHLRRDLDTSGAIQWLPLLGGAAFGYLQNLSEDVYRMRKRQDNAGVWDPSSVGVLGYFFAKLPRIFDNLLPKPKSLTPAPAARPAAPNTAGWFAPALGGAAATYAAQILGVLPTVHLNVQLGRGPAGNLAIVPTLPKMTIVPTT